MSQHVPQPPPPPPAAPMFLKNIPAQAWARTLLIPLIFFGGAFLMAAFVAALGLGAMSAAAGFGATMPQLMDGGPSWIVVTIQLLGMGFLSPLSLGIDIAEFGMFSGGGSAFFVPWLVPAGGIVAVAVTQRFLGGNIRAQQTGIRWMLAGISGLLFATVITVLAATVRFRYDAGSEFIDGRFWAHSASLPGFVVAGVLVGCITYLLLLPRRGLVVQRILSVIATVFEHVLILAGGAALAIVIAAFVQSETEVGQMILAGFLTVGFFAFSMLHFVPTVMSGSQEFVDGAESLSIFTLPPAVWIIGLIVMVAVLFITACRWSLRTRFLAHAPWAWIALPATYLVVGILLTSANGVYLSMYMAGETVQMAISSAAWGFLVWLAIGGVVQVLASYLMPRLLQHLPAGLVRALSVGLGQQVGSAHQPPMDRTMQLPGAVGVEPERQPRGMTRKSKILLWTGAGVVVLVVAGWIAHTVLARTVFGPEETAEAYLQAVVDGRAEDALEIMGPNVTDELRALATDEVYQAAEDRPDRFELGDVNYAGSAANDVTVDATIYQSGKAYPLELGLSESGTQAMVFNDWDLQTGMVSGRALYATGPSQLTVNEVEIEVEPSGLGTTEDSSSPAYEGQNIDGWLKQHGFVLLPGTYTFAAPESSQYLSHGQDLELTITPGEHLQTPIEFNQGYTEAFETDVIAEVEQRLESCLADETIRIADCEAASWEDTGWNAMTNMERTWATTPEIELVPVETDAYGDGVDLTEYSGPVVARIVEGDITVSYEVRDDEDQDWQERERTYAPFGGWGDEMEFPVTLDGDEIQIDYSALDEPNPSWLSQEFRD
ncbi:MAG TPA: hypothetical protein H9822_01710 [Candidatus Yaniella excrementavium]|nr:hypothetical protein [Candidatus Yaniella excrementavium]